MKSIFDETLSNQLVYKYTFYIVAETILYTKLLQYYILYNYTSRLLDHFLKAK